MQLFRLHEDPIENAKLFPDKYTYNQIRESGQIMTIALGLNGGDFNVHHENHPIVQWVAESLANWLDAYALTAASHNEWLKRYGHPTSRVHGSFKTINEVYSDALALLPRSGYSLQPCAFPERYKVVEEPESIEDVITNYRNYVVEAKQPKNWFSFDKAMKPDMYQ